MENIINNSFSKANCCFDDDCGEVTFGHILIDSPVHNLSGYADEEE